MGLEVTTKDTVVEGTWLQTERTIDAMNMQVVHTVDREMFAVKKFLALAEAAKIKCIKTSYVRI